MSIDAGGVLFDMDGVLVSSIASVRRCWRQWAAHYGVPGASELEVPHGTRAADIIRLLKPEIDPAEGLRLIEELEVADVGDIEVLAGAREILAAIPPHRWTIVTSATRPLVLARLRAAGLALPEQLITAEMVDHGKPDPEPYVRGAEILGLPTADCLVIEDAPSGVRAGVAAGCRVLGVLGTFPAEDLRVAGAQWVVSSLAQVRIEDREGRLRFVLPEV